MFLMVFKLALDFVWLLPSWLVILLVAELFSAWEILKGYGMSE
jgi:hypothetical protein